MCERPIQGSSKNCGSTDKIPEIWRGIHENQCVRVVEKEDEEVQSDWATDDEDNTIEVYPEVVSLEDAFRKIGQPLSEDVAAFSGVKEDELKAIRWEPILAEIASIQKQDDAIAQVIYWAGTSDETIDMPSLGTNLMPKEWAIQYGPETLAYCLRWDKLSIKDEIVYKE